MELPEEHIRQLSKTQADLTRRFEALEEWFDIRYVRIRPRKVAGKPFEAEFSYQKRPRKFYGRKPRATAIPHRQGS